MTAEIRLSANTGADGILEQVEGLADIVDAIQITDSPGGKAHMSPLAASSILLQHGFDPVLHLTCRDRNRIALRSDLLGAAALGVTSLLIRRGDNLPRDPATNLKTVFDLDATALIAAARAMDEEAPFGKAVNFLVGTAAVAFKPGRNWKPAQITEKAKAGANFIQTQLCFDADLLRHYAAKIVQHKLTEKIDVIVNLAALPSADSAEWLGKNLRGAAVPDKIMKRMRQATDPENEGIQICTELLLECQSIPGIVGANLVSIGNMDSIRKAIKMTAFRD